MSLDSWLGIIGTILGVLGIITGYIFYRRGLRLKEPSWYSRSNNWIKGYKSKISDLEVLYKGERVENFTVSRILIWNNGLDTINYEDIASANPLKIACTNEVKMLDVQLVTANNPASQFSCKLLKEKNEADISFDYFDKGQGAVLQVIHTGVSDSDIWVEGVVKGAGLMRYRKIQFDIVSSGSQSERFKSKVFRIGLTIFLLFGGFTFSFIAVVFIINLYNSGWNVPPIASPGSSPSEGDSFMSWIILIFIIAFGPLMLYGSIDLWRRRVPPGLEEFGKDMDL